MAEKRIGVEILAGNASPFPVSSAIVVVLSFCFCYACDKMFGRTVIRWLGIR